MWKLAERFQAYGQQHYEEKWNDLIQSYNETFCNIKKQVKGGGDSGLVATQSFLSTLLMVKGEAKNSCIVIEIDEFSCCLFGIWNDIER